MSHVISTTPTRTVRACIAMLAVFALSALAAVAVPAHAGSGTADPAPIGQDLRSPDAVDAATPRLDVSAQDLRSPDAVDAATPRLDGGTDGVGVQAATAEAGGFDWSSAGIAVAGLLGLLVVAGAAATHVRHSRRTVARP